MTKSTVDEQAELPPVRPGCGKCVNCQYLKHMRPEIFTALIAPYAHDRVLRGWALIQAGRPCTEGK